MPELLLILFSTGAINKIYGMLIISFLIIVPWQLMKSGRIYVNGMASAPFYTLGLFGLLYFVIGEFSIQGFLYYMVCPLLAYLTGWCMIDTRKKCAEKNIGRGIAAFLLGYTVHAFLNYSINIGHQRWELTDYFTGSLHGATGSGCINTLAFSIAVCVLVSEKDKLKKIVGLVCTLISLLYAFLLGTRTQFIIFFIVSFVFLLCYLYERSGIRSVLFMTVIVLVMVGIGFYLYTRNVFAIKTYVDTSNLMARYQSSSGLQNADNYRISSLTRGLDNLLSHPLGGLKDTPYYHNFWLDIGRVAGILPFVCMAFYSVLINVHASRIIRCKKVKASFRYLLLCVYLGIQINFFVEPILEGLMDFFLVFTFINGMMEYYYHSFIISK